MRTLQQSLGRNQKMGIFRESQLFFEVNQAFTTFFSANKIDLPFSISVKETLECITILVRVNNSTMSSWLKIEQELVMLFIHSHLQKKGLIQPETVVIVTVK